jgi:hypothetical protein
MGAFQLRIFHLLLNYTNMTACKMVRREKRKKYEAIDSYLPEKKDKKLCKAVKNAFKHAHTAN